MNIKNRKIMKTINPPQKASLNFKKWRSYVNTLNKPTETFKIVPNLLKYYKPGSFGFLNHLNMKIVIGSDQHSITEKIQSSIQHKIKPQGIKFFEVKMIGSTFYFIVNRFELSNEYIENGAENMTEAIRNRVRKFVRFVAPGTQSAQTIEEISKSITIKILEKL